MCNCQKTEWICQKDVQDLPTKCVQETLELSIKAKLMYIDYEGQSDGESIKKLLSNIKPKNLVNI